MSRLLCCLTILFAVISNGLCYLNGDDNWLNIELQHALDLEHPNHFVHRANLTSTEAPRPIENRIKEQDARSLIALASRGDFYRLRAIVTYANGDTKTYLTAIKACTLLLAELNDVLWISVDANSFINAITLTIGNTVRDQDCANVAFNPAELRTFYTDIVMRLTETAPVPDTASFIQKVEREREAREKGQGKDNRNFLAKYWMYIVPVVLLVFVSGATNQEAAK